MLRRNSNFCSVPYSNHGPCSFSCSTNEVLGWRLSTQFSAQTRAHNCYVKNRTSSYYLQQLKVTYLTDRQAPRVDQPGRISMISQITPDCPAFSWPNQLLCSMQRKRSSDRVRIVMDRSSASCQAFDMVPMGTRGQGRSPLRS